LPERGVSQMFVPTQGPFLQRKPLETVVSNMTLKKANNLMVVTCVTLTSRSVVGSRKPLSVGVGWGTALCGSRWLRTCGPARPNCEEKEFCKVPGSRPGGKASLLWGAGQRTNGSAAAGRGGALFLRRGCQRKDARG
jgi:hypothetical protein